jgi:hypothetical protein
VPRIPEIDLINATDSVFIKSDCKDIECSVDDK